MGDFLFLLHEEMAGPGLLGEWVEARGDHVHVIPVRTAGAFPDPASYEAIIPLGSVESVADARANFILAERAYVRTAIDCGVPVLGICFGGQLLASALGAAVRPAPIPEIGWGEIEVADGAPLQPGPWFQWHVDRFDVPDSAELLARSPTAPQAIVSGRSIGLQFHPEADDTVVQRWARSGADALDDLGVDTEALLEQNARLSTGAHTRAFRLFDDLAEALWT